MSTRRNTRSSVSVADGGQTRHWLGRGRAEKAPSRVAVAETCQHAKKRFCRAFLLGNRITPCGLRGGL